MRPTVFISGPYRFFFFSREETRVHVHVVCADGEAKFWLEPVINLANQTGLPTHTLKNIQQIVEEHEDEIRHAWKQHFSD